ncbi:hypothetical protein UM93_05910 [Psychromicrobium lacuslunae]|uniref:Uncharacterized protein n=1 Tax=Psychromicrobium lacuslunae TaxID=1618207 RepID=A0A0D4BYG4_9MICC|nr:hypothetical protein UM93_05910 [Psychromicrobium lacuslunae]
MEVIANIIIFSGLAGLVSAGWWLISLTVTCTEGQSASGMTLTKFEMQASKRRPWLPWLRHTQSVRRPSNVGHSWRIADRRFGPELRRALRAHNKYYRRTLLPIVVEFLSVELVIVLLAFFGGYSIVTTYTSLGLIFIVMAQAGFTYTRFSTRWLRRFPSTWKIIHVSNKAAGFFVQDSTKGDERSPVATLWAIEIELVEHLQVSPSSRWSSQERARNWLALLKPRLIELSTMGDPLTRTASRVEMLKWIDNVLHDLTVPAQGQEHSKGLDKDLAAIRATRPSRTANVTSWIIAGFGIFMVTMAFLMEWLGTRSGRSQFLEWLPTAAAAIPGISTWVAAIFGVAFGLYQWIAAYRRRAR